MKKQEQKKKKGEDKEEQTRERRRRSVKKHFDFAISSLCKRLKCSSAHKRPVGPQTAVKLGDALREFPTVFCSALASCNNC